MQHRLVAVAVDHHDVARRDGGVPDDLVRGGRAVGDEEQVIAAEDARGIALARRHRTGMVEQLTELVDRIADIRPQHVLAEELVKHLADRALQERHPARVSGAVPGIRTILRVVGERPEERWRQAVEVGPRLAHDVARDELRRVLEHVDEAVQLAQHVVRNVTRGARLAVEEDRDVGVAPADLFDEGPQVGDCLVGKLGRAELLVVDRQDERGGAALLLGEAGKVAEAGDAEHLPAFLLDRLRDRTDREPARVLGAEVLVDDDDGKAEAHGRVRGPVLSWRPECGAGAMVAECSQRTPVPSSPIRRFGRQGF